MPRDQPKSPPKPKSSPTDDHARRISRAIAKGRPLPLSDGLEEYCASSPNEIFAAFAGAARHMPPAGKDEALARGYLCLLQRMLEHLRYRTDRGYDDAARLISEFQAGVVAQVEAGEVDGRMLAFVGGALHQSTIPASPELTEASARHLARHAAARGAGRDKGGPVPADVREALGGILEDCGRDLFMVAGSLLESGHAAPVETRGAVAAALALAGIPDTRSAAVLFLLDPDPEVRRAVAEVLEEVASELTPVDVRRLIAMRNWRPERELPYFDAIIRKSSAASIAGIQWDTGGAAETIVATTVDGAMAQGFLMASPAGRKKRLSSVLTKGGVADAWSGTPEPRRRVEASMTSAEMHTPVHAVSRAYLDRAVAHHLALTIEKGEVPPPGLLQVAETIGSDGWQPKRTDFTAALAGLIAEVPEAMREPAAYASVLRRSGKLADIEVIEDSWFEDDPQVAEAVARGRGSNREKLASYLLQTVIARRRDRWAEIVLRTALWMREAPPEDDLCWRELALVAQALADGRDMTEISLMRDVALRTIAVHRSAEPMLSERDRTQIIRMLSQMPAAAGGAHR
jgi:hypothetical protein